MTISTHTAAHKQKRKLMREWMLGTSFRATLLIATIVFGVLYVFQMSSMSTKGFEMSDLETQIAKLEHENRQLHVKIAQYRSMQSIQERLADMNMVPAGEVAYVTTVGTAVARR